ncbi:MAG: hypothetical protein JST48_07895 [Bacteroidetes bacterium]|nr:hypothetical protein [Bacteroidota bacterium]
MSKVDTFFKNKLEGHTVPPRETAWNTIEAGLSKKNKTMVWRVAASILLVGTLIGILLWSQQTDTTKKDFALHSNKKVKPMASSPRVEPKQKTQEQEPIKHLTTTKKHITKTNQVSIKKKITTNTQPASVQPDEVKKQNDAREEIQKSEATVKREVASVKQKPIKLEFTLEDVSSEETVATATEEKKSGLKKVLNLARDLKQGEGIFGDLREKKNELFALNFITGKTKSKN